MKSNSKTFNQILKEVSNEANRHLWERAFNANRIAQDSSVSPHGKFIATEVRNRALGQVCGRGRALVGTDVQREVRIDLSFHSDFVYPLRSFLHQTKLSTAGLN